MGIRHLQMVILVFFLSCAINAQTVPTDSLPAVSTDSLPAVSTDSLPAVPMPVLDSNLRIINLNPFFSIHVDSLLSYQLKINKSDPEYYWYIKNSPAGLKIDKDNGRLSFKAEKSYFLTGKLKYDQEYTVKLGVQNLEDATDKIDTSFNLIFYNTEVIYPSLKPTIANTVTIEEGQFISFNLLCENGAFSIESILFTSSIPIANYKLVKKCDDIFEWVPGFDFVKESDATKEKVVFLNFIGTTKINFKDTATVKIIVKDALNFPMANTEYGLILKNLQNYVYALKSAFFQLDRSQKKVKRTRTGFDLTAAGAALSGTILSSASRESSKNIGKVLPGVGVALVPVKEATAPVKNVEQNQASLIRSSIKRLEYMLTDNLLIGDKDPLVVNKTNKLKDELKQSQLQLIDVPIDDTLLRNSSGKENLDDYFNNPKVNKKYRLKSR